MAGYGRKRSPNHVLSVGLAAGMVMSMGAKAEAILEQFEGLPPDEQRALCRELERRLAAKPAGESMVSR